MFFFFSILFFFSFQSVCSRRISVYFIGGGGFVSAAKLGRARLCVSLRRSRGVGYERVFARRVQTRRAERWGKRFSSTRERSFLPAVST